MSICLAVISCMARLQTDVPYAVRRLLRLIFAEVSLRMTYGTTVPSASSRKSNKRRAWGQWGPRAWPALPDPIAAGGISAGDAAPALFFPLNQRQVSWMIA